MPVLTDRDIRSQVLRRPPLIDPFSEESLEGASYDLRLGAQYAKGGEVRTLTTNSPSLLVKTGEFAVLTSLEELNLPLDLIGHNGIMSPWAKKGLVSLFSPQIDPGFEGMLVVPVFNSGDSPISIQLSEKIFTVEFIKTTKPASRGWSARFGRQTSIKNLSAPVATRPSLEDLLSLREEVIATRAMLEKVTNQQQVLEIRMREFRERRNLRLAWTGLFIAFITLVFAAIGFVSGFAHLFTQMIVNFARLVFGV